MPCMTFTRRRGERVVIQTAHGPIFVWISSRSRVSVEAPREVQVDREEIYDAKLKAKKGGQA